VCDLDKIKPKSMRKLKKSVYNILYFVLMNTSIFVTIKTIKDVRQLYKSEEFTNSLFGSLLNTIFGLLIVMLFNPALCKGQDLFAGGNSNISGGNSSFYWSGTIFLTAINGTTTYFNIKKLHKHDKYRSNAIFGVLSGGAQTAFGVINMKAKTNYQEFATGINLGVGLTTLVTSVIRLATKNPPKENNLTFNMIYLPSEGANDPILGVCLRKQLR
jgi:hypothetical protein